MVGVCVGMVGVCMFFRGWTSWSRASMVSSPFSPSPKLYTWPAQLTPRLRGRRSSPAGAESCDAPTGNAGAGRTTASSACLRSLEHPPVRVQLPGPLEPARRLAPSFPDERMQVLEHDLEALLAHLRRAHERSRQICHVKHPEHLWTQKCVNILSPDSSRARRGTTMPKSVAYSSRLENAKRFGMYNNKKKHDHAGVQLIQKHANQTGQN